MTQTNPALTNIQSLALVCPGGIGDVLLFSPVIRACKALLPTARIALLVESRSQAAGQLLAIAWIPLCRFVCRAYLRGKRLWGCGKPCPRANTMV